ncbi:hypothetical protein CBM2617_U10068 [Cupriavidus taiwanensis]|nr:hypothetical protein CBM2617_U10068 [Cupriavidus taiwanensis]SPA53801.1 hypothetical protein CBM2629_U10063 [Cupriavidus taiwanensis]
MPMSPKKATPNPCIADVAERFRGGNSPVRTLAGMAGGVNRLKGGRIPTLHFLRKKEVHMINACWV